MAGSFPYGSMPLGAGDEEPEEVGPPSFVDTGGGGGIELPRAPHWRYIPPRRRKVRPRAEEAPKPKVTYTLPPAPPKPERTAAERALDEAIAQESIRALLAQEQAIERMFQPQEEDPAIAMREREEEELAILLQIL